MFYKSCNSWHFNLLNQNISKVENEMRTKVILRETKDTNLFFYPYAELEFNSVLCHLLYLSTQPSVVRFVINRRLQFANKVMAMPKTDS